MDINQRMSNLSPQQRNRFLQKLQQQNIDIFQLPIAPVKRKKDEAFPLSYAQKRLWIIQQMEPGNTAYNIVRITQLQGNLDKTLLEKSIQEIIKRHEILRTIFLSDNEVPRQVILHQLVIPLEIIDLKGLTAEKKNNAIKEVIRRENLYAFDLTAGPLLRTTLLESAEYDYLFVMTSHHIITDGTSVRYFGSEMAQFYEAFSQGTSPASLLPPLPIQYVDYACWQRQWFYSQSPFLEKQEQYWLNVFSGEIPVLTLPTDYPRPKMQSFEGTSVVFILERQDTNALIRLALNRETTLYIVLVALLNVFLAKISSQEDIIIGATTSGRRHPQLNHLMGMFINTLALRNHPQGTKTFDHFLHEVKEQTLKTLDNQDYPYEKLVEKVLVNRDSNRNPLFDVILNFYNFENIGTDELETAGLKMKPYTVVTETSKFDIAFSIILRNNRLTCTCEYCTRLFMENTIRRFIQYLKKIISSITGNPGTRISDVEIIPETEKTQLLYDFNDTAAAYPRDKTIHDLFQQQVEQTPDKIAVVAPMPLKYRHYMTNRTYISYKDLNEKSNQLAHLLREKGIKPDTTAAIMIERSIEMIIGILGILKAGGAYLPIEPEYPEERINYMLKDSNVGILVTTPKLQDKVKAEVKLINLTYANEPFPSTLTSTCQVGPANLAYIIYTSGTTGKPKGCLVQHRNLIRLIFNDKFQFDFGLNDAWTLFHSYCFDFSVWEIWGALGYGGRLIIVPQSTTKNPRKFLDLLIQEKVTVLNQTPGAFYQLLEEALIEPADPVNIKYIIFGGEALVPVKLKQWKKRYPQTKLINMYGITEITVHVTFKEITTREIQSKESNIGKPIPTLSIYIMDQYLKLQPIGTAGEVCVGGKGVARGYLNQPVLTAAKFVENPYKPGEKLYKSGDLAKYFISGEIEYLGRIDHQVKIRGYRIELGEIENLLLHHEQVKEALVIAETVANKDSTSDTYLCAYLVSEEKLNTSELKIFLSHHLPHYMIPSDMVQIEKIPLTATGKIDRKKLPKPGILTGTQYTAPRNEKEQQLVKIWSDLLGRDPSHTSQLQSSIGIDDNFFERGGHSLKAAAMAAKIHKILNVKVPLEEIFKNQTIRGLANYIGPLKKDKYASITAVEKKDYYLLSSAQKRLYFLQQMNPASIGYNMPLTLTPGKNININSLETALKKLISRHESLRTSFINLEGTPVQKVHEPDEMKFEIEYHKFEVKAKENRSSILEGTRGLASMSEEPAASTIKDFICPFDLSRAPLIRSGIIKSPDGHYIWMVDLHHIVSDGISQTILTREFISLYNRKELKPLKLQYKDFSQWQNHLFASGAIKNQQDYWLELYSGIREIPRLNLPLDYKRPEIFNFSGNHYRFMLDRETTKKLKSLSNQQGGTLYMNILAALNAFFYKYTGQTDIIIGSVSSGRPHPELQHIIGVFVNTQAIRNYPEGNKTYQTLLKEVIANSIKAFENQEVQFDQLVDQLHLERDFSTNPLFDICMVAQDPEERENEIFPTLQYAQKISKFDMTFQIIEAGENIHINIDYYTAIFKEETIKRMASHFQNMVKTVILDPSLKLKEIQLMSAEEKNQILYAFNHTIRNYPKEKNLHELFTEQARGIPDNIALHGQSDSITYKTLNEKSDQLAGLLIEKGVGTDSIVGMMVERSIEMISAMLAILKAGGAYLPIDPEYPQKRINYMLKDSGARLLVTTISLSGKLSIVSCQLLIVNEILPNRRRLNNPPQEANQANLAYIIYTSGSTGRPKGVLVQHQNVVRLVKNQNFIDCTPNDRLLLTGSLGFDITTFEIWWPLLNGLTLFLVNQNIILDPEKLTGVITGNRISILHLIPQLFNQLAAQGLDIFAKLRYFLVGGDRVRPHYINRLHNTYKHINILHMYGPTENTTFSTFHRVNQNYDFAIPIGKPIANSFVYIMNRWNQLTPIGVPGELVVGGDGVARGYQNNPELTAEKFCHVLKDYQQYHDGHYRSYKSYIIYKTGDLARWLPDGNIEFFGRIDNQIKIRGIRIELEEIEKQLLKHKNIKEAVVDSRDDVLCAYVVMNDSDSSQNKKNLLIRELKDHLLSTLPEYMVPTYFMQIENIPLTPNGKIDRKALHQPDIIKTQKYQPPGNEMEKKLVETWESVLGIDNIGINDNFFALGGDSIKSIQVAARMNKAGYKIEMKDILQNKTIARLAPLVKKKPKKELIPTDRVYHTISPQDRSTVTTYIQNHIPGTTAIDFLYPLSPMQNGMLYHSLKDKTSHAYFEQTIFTMEGEIEDSLLENSVNKLVERYDVLRTVFVYEELDEPLQVVLNHRKLKLYYEDISKLRQDETVPYLEEFKTKDKTKGFDLSRDMLMRLALFKTGTYSYQLVWTFHHILMDGWCLGILYKELIQIYHSSGNVKPVELDTVTPYIEYIKWLETRDKKTGLKYWQEYLEGFEELTGLPNHPSLESDSHLTRDNATVYEVREYDLVLTPGETSGLQTFAAKNQVTLNNLFRTLWGLLLQKYNNSNDVVFGAVVSGRPSDIPGIEQMVGLFINTIPVRINSNDTYEFPHLLSIVQKNALSSNPHEYLPLAEIQATSTLKRNLIDHIMVFENYPIPTEIKHIDIGTTKKPAFLVKDIRYNEQTNYNFNIIIVPGMPLLVRFSYNARLYEEEFVKQVGLHFKNLINQVPDHPGKKISHLEILSEQEKQRILVEFNQTQTQYPKSKTIHELFVQQVQQTPDKIAVATPLPLEYRTYRTDKTYISYKELNEKSAQLAHLLNEKGVKPDTIVGIMIKRSIEMIIGILGILKAGAAYLPIDTEYPQERIDYMLKDSGAKILLKNNDFTPEMFNNRPKGTPIYPSNPLNLAYIIYTSGTTGNPKGVMVNHFNVVRLIKNTNYVEFRPGDRILPTGALEFDASTFEIWGALLNGLQLHLVSNEIILTAEKLKNIIQKSNITLMWLTAPLFNQLSEQDIEIFRGLRSLLVGGDILSPSHINRLKARFPPLNIINGYGPTENTTFSTTYLINKIHKRNIPIGKPISNSTAYIIDPWNAISPVGIVGELILGGDGIARGYLNNPELTAEKFCLRRPGGLFSRKPPPWTPRKSFSLEGAHKDYMYPCIHASMQYHFLLPKSSIYRTGDLARWLPDGNIQFLGRIDQQIKLRGFRIELGEIETQLENHPAIKEAFVITTTKDHPGEKQLCAYIVSEQVPDITALREFLAKKLPNYMIPAYFITLDHIPLTPNGKINKKALPEPESGALLPDKKYLPPGNHIEKILVETWQQVLGVKPVGITDNFFEIGGDSIKVIQIAARLKKYNLDLNIEDLFLNPVIKDLAKSVKKTRRIIHQAIVKGKVPLTPIQQRFFENDFEHKHHFNQAVMLFRPRGFDQKILEKVFTKIVEHHDALRMVYRIEDNHEQHQKHDSKKVNVLQVNQGIQGKLFDLNLVNLKHKEISDDKIEKEIEKEANRIQESIDLKTGPLVKSGLFKTAKGDHLLIVIHHLVVDGISWRILLEDFALGYQLAQQGKEIKFQEKTDSFKYWAQKLTQYAGGAEQHVNKPLSRELEYWRTIDSKKIDPLPEDYQLSPQKKKNKYAGTVTVSLNSRETGYLLRNTHRAYSTEINDILLTALAMALNQWAGNEKVLITLEGHGREPIIKDIDTSRTVGWFTSQYPVLLEISSAHDLSYLIKHIKETLRRIPNKGIGYGLLRYLTPGKKKQGSVFQLEPEINFNYLGQFQWEDKAQPHPGLFRISRVSPGRSVSPELARNHTLDINGMLLKGQLQLSFSYNIHQYNKKTIETLSHGYKSHLLKIIRHCMNRGKTGLTPSDFGCSHLSLEDFSKITHHIPAALGKETEIQLIYPLSPMQKGMLFHALKDEGSNAYFEQAVFSMEGEIEKSSLETSANKIIERYDVLRTVFIYEGLDNPLQIVLNTRKIQVYYKNISHLNETEKEFYLEEFKTKDREKGFDLSCDMLMRLALFKTGTHSYQLVWTFHHILMDGWCLGILYKELIQIYHSSGNVKPVELDTVTPYIEYIKWLETRDKKTGLKYWQEYLEGFEEPTGLPNYPSLETDSHLTRDNATVYKVREYDLVLTPGETSGLKTFAAKNQVTLNNLFRTLWGLLLQKYNNSNDVVFGAVVSGRPSEIPGIEQMVGLFINTIPVRINSHDTYEFPHLLSIVQKNALSSNPHEYLPLAEIQATSTLKRNLIDHIMVFENYPIPTEIKHIDIGTAQQPVFAVKDIRFNEQTNYNFNIVIIPGMPLLVRFSYNARLYEKEFVKQVSLHFKNLINQVLDHPGKKISHLQILSEQEKQRILVELNQTQTQYPKGKTIHELFAQQVQQTPDKIAVAIPLPLKYRAYRTDKTYISYKELNEKSGQLAHLLGEKGVKPGTIVGIMIKRSSEMIMGILGILKAGGAYLPIDPQYPEERTKYLLKDSSVNLTVTTQDLSENLKKLSIVNCQLLIVNEIPSNRRRLNNHSINNYQSTIDNLQLESFNLAYIIYTSGSTGSPKGVLVQHRNVVRLVKNQNFIYCTPNDRLLLTGSLGFDITTFEIWWPLLNGLTLFLVDQNIILDAEKLSELIIANNITILHLIPQLFNQLAAQQLDIFAKLSYFLVGGDLVRPHYVNRLRKTYKHINILHMYGPTENTTFSTFHPVNQDYDYAVPIGKPIANSFVYILDRWNQLTPISVPGELVVGGDGLARGYLNNPELTAEKFCLRRPGGLFSAKGDRCRLQVQVELSKTSSATKPSLIGPPCHGAPWTPRKSFSLERAHKDYIHESMQYHFPSPHYPIYYTGDLARWFPDGNIEFLGRIDQQIKIRGIRIEPGEIEKQLVKHKNIKEAVVIIITKDHPAEKQLCTYIVAEQRPDITGLREFLAKKLPNYMIPAYFITLDHIPLTPNGKINRNALPHPEILPGKKYIAPRNEIEKKLTKIWSDILDVKEHTSIGIDDNFFELGGHSLNATILTAKIYKTFNTRISLAQVFDSPSIKELSDFIHSTGKTRFISITPIEKKEYYPLSSSQKQFYVMQRIDPRATTYNLPIILEIKGELEQEKLEKVFNQLIQRHETLRTSFSIINQNMVQQVHDEVEFAIEYHEMKEVEPLINSFIRPFDLTQAPLLQVGLIKLPKSLTNGKHTSRIFIVNLHHILSDFLSHEILIREFFNLYMEKTLPALKLQYKDYSHWQNQADLLGEIKKQEKYWLNLYKDGHPDLNIPTDFPRSRVQSFAGSFISFDIDKEKAYKLKTLAREENATLFMVYLAVTCIFLHKLSGQLDITVGTVVAGRRHPELEHIIGPFVNTLVLRNSLELDKTFRQLLEQVRKQTLDAFDNQDYRFEDLVQKVMAERDTSRNPLFDVMFSFASQETDENKVTQQDQFLETTGIKAEPFENPAKSAKFDLTLSGADVGLQCGFSMEYCTALFKTQTIQRYIMYIQEIISAVAKNADIPLKHITLATDLEAVTSDVYHQSSEFQF